MKKLPLSILSLAGILALTGCGETYSYKEVVVVEKKCPTKIYADEPGLVLFKGETEKVTVNVRPLDASDAELIYESNDINVATVSDSGLITAVGGGSCDIKISSKENPKVYEIVTVGVEENIISGTEEEITQQRKLIADALTRQKAVQTSNFGTADDLDKVTVFNGYKTLTTRDGKHYYSESVRQDFTVSRDSGFFKFNIDDKETISPSGNMSFDSYGYYFFCNEDFDAHIYKYSDSSARRCKVNAQDLLGKVDRTEVTCMMLDQFFVAGRKVFTNQFDNSLETSELGRGSSASKGGFTNNGVSSAGIYYVIPPEERTVGKAEEDDMHIPAGTKYTVSGSYSYHWIDGRIDAASGVIIYDYNLDDSHYVMTQTSYTRVLLEKEVDIVYPNKDDYQEVAGLFDL